MSTVTPVKQPDTAYVGRVLAERYRITELLGRGGMGSVWAAEHVNLKTPVAVKMIRAEVAETENARARFLKEARAAASLRSPNVVQIFDYGVENGDPYIAMELLEGESLKERLRERERLSPPEVLEMVRQVGRAVAKAYGAGIVHRDLKPDNIFIVTEDEGELYKVLDFGIAKGMPSGTLDASTQTGAMLGTPFYMSPEQAKDSSLVDPRSDLWALAVIAYECLVGKRPFVADSLPALTVQILMEPIPVPSEHGDVPGGFDDWFARAAQRDPDERFQSARELTEALATALDVPLGSASLWPIVPTHPPQRTGSATRWAGWAGVSAAAAAGVAWMVLRPPEPPEAQRSNSPSTEARTAAVAGPDDASLSGKRPVANAPPVDDTPDSGEPPAVATVEVLFELSGAKSAEVFHNGESLGTIPGPLKLERSDEPIALQVQADGFVGVDLEITPGAEGKRAVRMKRRRPKKPTPKDTKAAEPKSSIGEIEF